MRAPERTPGSAPGSRILVVMAAGVETEALPHAHQVARHRVHRAVGRDHGREEDAERDGRDLRPLADAEPQDEERKQRDLGDREERRDHRHADRARHREDADRKASDQPGREAEQEAAGDAPGRRGEMAPQLAARRQLADRRADPQRARQRERADRRRRRSRSARGRGSRPGRARRAPDASAARTPCRGGRPADRRRSRRHLARGQRRFGSQQRPQAVLDLDHQRIAAPPLLARHADRNARALAAGAS